MQNGEMMELGCENGTGRDSRRQSGSSIQGRQPAKLCLTDDNQTSKSQCFQWNRPVSMDTAHNSAEVGCRLPAMHTKPRGLRINAGIS